MKVSRRAAIAFGAADVLSAALVAFGVFVALPTRWWPVDCVATLLVMLEIGGGAGLIAGVRGSTRLAWIASVAALVVGLLLVTTLALTASWLSGVYGSVGHGGAIILVLVAALALPYLVVVPLVQLVWLSSPGAGSRR